MRLKIRPATRVEFATAIDWAAAEGWNPGLGDLEAFHAADPNGFLMGWLGDVPVSSISVVRYGDGFGFLGFYIVAPEFRGRGFGLATWQAGLDHLNGRVIGLDGVVEQLENYRQSGFVLAGRNIRFRGNPDFGRAGHPQHKIEKIATVDLAAVTGYDRQFFPGDRSGFVRDWVRDQSDRVRMSRFVTLGDRLAGYGTIRKCRKGYKIGPLFAETSAIALELIACLCQEYGSEGEINLDVPEGNAEGLAIAKQLGLAPVFETARMYLGNAPDLPIGKIFGVTTFELG